MEILVLAGVALLVVALIRSRNRDAQHGLHYHDGMYYHSTADSTQGAGARHGGDWGGRDMGHDHHHHHGGHDSDSSSGGGWGGDAAGDGGGVGGGDGGGGE